MLPPEFQYILTCHETNIRSIYSEGCLYNCFASVIAVSISHHKAHTTAHGALSAHSYNKLEAQLMNIDRDLRKVMAGISTQNSQRPSVQQGIVNF